MSSYLDNQHTDDFRVARLVKYDRPRAGRGKSYWDVLTPHTICGERRPPVRRQGSYHVRADAVACLREMGYLPAPVEGEWWRVERCHWMWIVPAEDEARALYARMEAFLGPQKWGRLGTACYRHPCGDWRIVASRCPAEPISPSLVPELTALCVEFGLGEG